MIISCGEGLYLPARAVPRRPTVASCKSVICENPMQLRAQKIEPNPNNKQSTLMSQHAGYARVAFNFALSSFKAGLEKDELTHL